MSIRKFFNSIKWILVASIFAITTQSFANTAISFDGHDDYASFNTWTPTGTFKVQVWLGAAPDDRPFVLSNSKTREFIKLGPSFVQVQFGKNWPGSWTKLDISKSLYVEIQIEKGKMWVSDGVNEDTVYHDAIDPQAISYDTMFRRDSVYYSAGLLKAIALSDLNNSSNNRNIYFSENGSPIVESYNVNDTFKLHTTNNNYVSGLGDLSPSMPTITIDKSIVDTTHLMTAGVSFNGIDEYGEMDEWKPSGPYKIMAWLGDEEEHSPFILSNSKTLKYIRFGDSFVQAQFGSSHPGSWGRLDIAGRRFFELTVEPGQLTASDGVNSHTVRNEEINPYNISYDTFFRRGRTYAKGSLKAFALVDLNNPLNNRNIGFDKDGKPIILSNDPDASLVLHNFEADNVVAGLEAPSEILPKIQNATVEEPKVGHSSIYFDGEDSYGEFDLWQPTGDFKIMAWLGDEAFDRMFLLSNSQSNEYVCIGHSFAQMQFNRSWPGTWNDLDINKSRFVEILIEKGKMTTSDGTNTNQRLDDAIDPTAVSYDNLFRRSGVYSKGSLKALALIDLNDPTNSRTFSFDDFGSPIVQSNLANSYLTLHNIGEDYVAISTEAFADLPIIETGTTIGGSQEGQITLASINLESDQNEQELNLNSTNIESENDIVVVTSTNNSYDVNQHIELSSNDSSISDSVINGTDLAVSFNGIDSYAEINRWTPEGEFTVIAWLANIDKDSSVFTPLLSDSQTGNYIAYSNNRVKVYSGNHTVLSDKIDFTESRYLQIRLANGELQVSNGFSNITTINEEINPSLFSFDWLFRVGNEFYAGALQGLGLIDHATHTNSRNIGFDNNGSPRVISENTESYLNLYKVASTDFIKGLNVPKPQLASVNSVAEMEQAILKRYPSLPMMQSDTNHGNDYAWEGYYWLRTYLHFYEVTGDSKYIDWAVKLANKKMYDTDAMRQLRTGVAQNDYEYAPKEFMNDTSRAAPGWKRPHRGQSVEVLIDGMILNGIMRLVDVIKSDENLKNYLPIADTYIERAIEIVATFDTSFSTTKRSTVAGSWFYINPTNEYDDDRGIWSNPLAYNHSLTMSTALVYLDKWLGGVDEYQFKIDKITEFFLEYLRFNEDGSCEWDYNYNYHEHLIKVEDVNHGHIDIGFFVVADREGYFENNEVMNCLAQTAAQNIAIGPGPIPNYVSGEGLGKSTEQIAFSYDWIDLAKYDESIEARAINILRAYPDMNWYRQYAAAALQLDK